MSTVCSPVTHTADVAVKNASSSDARDSPAVAVGSESSAVPMTTAPAKAAAMIRPGCRARGRRRTGPAAGHHTGRTGIEGTPAPSHEPSAACSGPAGRAAGGSVRSAADAAPSG